MPDAASPIAATKRPPRTLRPWWGPCALLVLVAACGGGVPSTAERSAARQLDVAFARLEAAPTELVLPRGREAPERLPIDGPFERSSAGAGRVAWRAPLPMRPRNLFFDRPSPGMEVFGPEGAPVRFDSALAGELPCWRFSANAFEVALPSDTTATPPVGQFTMVYPRATERERALNFGWAQREGPAFVQRSLQRGLETRTGLYLPTPASVAWRVDLPAQAVLHFEAAVLPPEAGALQIAARARVQVSVDGEHAGELEVSGREWSGVRLDLERWGGASRTVRFVTEGRGDDPYARVFLAEPTAYQPRVDPERVLLVFLDTLRHDHLGLYGYERATSPRLDAWAADAVVFEEARSVAPWTLPAARAALSGRQPELWERQHGLRLPEALAAGGWATGAFVGNVYLSSSFDMAVGWGSHTAANWPLIGEQIERVRDFHRRHPDRDTVVLLHTMDMHLPYTEPAAYRDLWAGRAPAGLTDLATRSAILAAADGDPSEVRSWLIDRYDQNIRYTDDALMDLVDELGDDASVVLFSDHGEEFWDHGGFEHGHSLYDELLRVPWIVRHRDLAPARVGERVSTAALTPTLLDLLGVQPDAPGSVLPLVRGGPWSAGPQAFGRPLYGGERWGVLDGHRKWTAHGGVQQLFDLDRDPGERDDVMAGVDAGPFHAALQSALDRRVRPLWRVQVSNGVRQPAEPVRIRISHPGGLVAAWAAADPVGQTDLELDGPDAEGVVTLNFPSPRKWTREVYLVPRGALADYAGLTFATEGEEVVVPEPSGTEERDAAGVGGETLFVRRLGARRFRLTYGVAPAPGAGRAVSATDDERVGELRALGYLEDDESSETGGR